MTLQDFIVCLGSFLEHHDGVITAVATVFLMIITGGLVWVGYRQIVTTRAQLRAYVLPDVAGILDGMMLTPNDPARANMPGIGLTIKNFGQTPAYDVISWAQIAVINITDEEKQIVPTLQKIGAATIGTGGTINKFLWFGRALTRTKCLMLVQGSGPFIYSDALNTAIFSSDIKVLISVSAIRACFRRPQMPL